MQDDTGTNLPAPEKYSYLRCTRVLEPGMVLTIEPGIYFIESLLSAWREGPYSKHFDWQKIEALKPFGGIRIEDNVVIHEKSVENMTRDLKLS
jgi:Xaa-Pro dipeptidase